MLLLGSNTPAAGSGRPDSAALADWVTALNARFRHHSATSVMEAILDDPARIALVSSFGAESVVLLHMVAVIDRSAPVVFIDTEMLFTETLVYQVEVTERLGLTNVRIIRGADLAARDPGRDLHKRDTDTCCELRKTLPLQVALAGFDGWITGRKRFQNGSRATLDFFEVETGAARIKINPLAHWARADIRTYMDENRLPRHPLVARGYPSIGCAPCTSPASDTEDPRAGRWRNQAKDECGIHFEDGRLIRTGEHA